MQQTFLKRGLRYTENSLTTLLPALQGLGALAARVCPTVPTRNINLLPFSYLSQHPTGLFQRVSSPAALHSWRLVDIVAGEVSSGFPNNTKRHVFNK